MRSLGRRTIGTAGRLAGALALAATLALGGGALGAAAVEPSAESAARGGDARAALPLYDQLMRTLQPVAIYSYSKSKDGRYSYGLEQDTDPSVGWSQREGGFLERDDIKVHETAVKFNVGSLGVGADDVTQAVLRFDERAAKWTSGGGAPEYKEGCVARLGIATTDWAGNRLHALFPNRPYLRAQDGSARSWNVTDHVKKQLASPADAALHHGFVLRGAMELADLQGDDDTSCKSYLSNIRLEVSVNVSERPAPVPKPAPKPAPPPAPTKPDLAITRLSGPTEVFDGVAATYEVAIANHGTPADKTAQVQINLAGALELVEIVEMGANPNTFTCQPNEFGTSCTGSLGGEGDPVQTQGTLFRVVARGKGAGSAVVVASADHFQMLDEMSEENNAALLEVTVK
jgi:hypothetical protein